MLEGFFSVIQELSVRPWTQTQVGSTYVRLPAAFDTSRHEITMAGDTVVFETAQAVGSLGESYSVAAGALPPRLSVDRYLLSGHIEALLSVKGGWKRREASTGFARYVAGNEDEVSYHLLVVRGLDVAYLEAKVPAAQQALFEAVYESQFFGSPIHADDM
jgi:hypothetical protein